MVGNPLSLWMILVSGYTGMSLPFWSALMSFISFKLMKFSCTPQNSQVIDLYPYTHTSSCLHLNGKAQTNDYQAHSPHKHPPSNTQKDPPKHASRHHQAKACIWQVKDKGHKGG